MKNKSMYPKGSTILKLSSSSPLLFLPNDASYLIPDDDDNIKHNSSNNNIISTQCHFCGIPLLILPCDNLHSNVNDTTNISSCANNTTDASSSSLCVKDANDVFFNKSNNNDSKNNTNTENNNTTIIQCECNSKVYYCTKDCKEKSLKRKCSFNYYFSNCGSISSSSSSTSISTSPSFISDMQNHDHESYLEMTSYILSLYTNNNSSGNNDYDNCQSQCNYILLMTILLHTYHWFNGTDIEFNKNVTLFLQNIRNTHNDNKNEQISNITSSNSFISEAWILFKGIYHNYIQSSTDSSSNDENKYFVGYNDFYNTYDYILYNHLVQLVSTPSILSNYITNNLWNDNDINNDNDLNDIQTFIHICSSKSSAYGNKTKNKVINHQSIINNKNDGLKETMINDNDKIKIMRKASQLSFLASSTSSSSYYYDKLSSKYKNYQTQHDFYILFSSFSICTATNDTNQMSSTLLSIEPTKVNHSCMPNCALQVTVKNNDVYKYYLDYEIIALFDIHIIPPSNSNEKSNNKNDDKFTMSYLPHMVPVEPSYRKRNKMLCRYFQHNAIDKSYNCPCLRCVHEQKQLSMPSSSTASSTDMIKSYKHLGDFAMQQQRYLDAFRIYDTILQHITASNTTTNTSSTLLLSDICHARAASRLGSNKFKYALQLWEEAYANEINHNNDLISNVIQKYHSYACNTAKTNATTRTEIHNVNDNNISLLLNNKCFITKASIISKKECNALIQHVELEREKIEWTTSRHYNVPTTDIPIHRLNETYLQWFNTVMTNQICPYLQILIHMHNSSTHKQKYYPNVYLHDAFLVKYDSNQQRHLPLHVDESMVSFVIVLNDNYDGGSTYFYDLNDSNDNDNSTILRLDVGAMIGFFGDIVLHGGDIVLRGTRYIIAGFCYYDYNYDQDNFMNEKKNNKHCNDDDAILSNKKRSCLDKSIAADNDHGNNKSSFSFNFNL